MDKHLNQLGISYELVAAVDGRLLSDEEANTKLAVPGSLTKSEIGCMMSHCKIYELMQQRDDEFALILEDDVLITEINMPTLFDKLEPFLNKQTVTLLTYFWIKDQKLSLRKVTNKDITVAKEHYYICSPASVNGIGRAGAYIISKECAGTLINYHTPKLQCHADAWEVYDEYGILPGVNCLYPMPVTENPEHGSEIDYTTNGVQSFGKKLINYLVTKNIPVFSYIFRKRRENFSNRYKNVILEN